MGPFGFSMTAVHCHNCLARAINTTSLEKGKEKGKKKGREESVGRAEGGIKRDGNSRANSRNSFRYTPRSDA